jgi:hypothetical protein
MTIHDSIFADITALGHLILLNWFHVIDIRKIEIIFVRKLPVQ